MKHYIEIQRVREEDVIVDGTVTMPKNTDAFRAGDIVSITEKIDGANASICYDAETKGLKCFSSKNELTFANQLRGFFPYVQSLDVTPFQTYADYIFFGEWLVSHTVRYEEDTYNHWYLFSVYDTKTTRWLPQSFVKEFAEKYHFPYVHELYYGPFISWEHVYSFANSPAYGTQQEGVVIKNQTALEEERGPHILKYVNPSFKETQKSNRKAKQEDPNKLKEKAKAEEIMRMIVTEARVRKLFHKLIDEGVLPEQLQPKDMKLVAMNLPKAVYEDLVKEEFETLKLAGEHGGNLCNRLTMQIIKQVLGM